jgi:hypothetical protein
MARPVECVNEMGNAYIMLDKRKITLHFRGLDVDDRKETAIYTEPLHGEISYLLTYLFTELSPS